MIWKKILGQYLNVYVAELAGQYAQFLKKLVGNQQVPEVACLLLLVFIMV
jgi:hypothetical protein